jgi:chorismate mutase
MADEPADTETIASCRHRIDEIDTAFIALWQERAGLSRRISALRLSGGGTKLLLADEYELLRRFRGAIGMDGALLATLLLRAGRESVRSPHPAGRRPVPVPAPEDA